MGVRVNVWLMLLIAGICPKYSLQQQDDWMAEVEGIQPTRLDKNWRDYVDDLAGQYQEVTEDTPARAEDDPRFLKPILDWVPTSPREVPFLAIIFTDDLGASQQYRDMFRGEPDPVLSHIEPRKACGGAVLTPSRVMTMCGCLSFYIWDTYDDLDTALFRWHDDTPKYMITRHDVRGSAAPRLYVMFSLLRFIPETTHIVDRDVNNWPTNDRLNCKRLIRNNANTNDTNIRARRADGELIVLPFQPEARVGIFPYWPTPPPINAVTDERYRQRVRIASIGMRLTTKVQIRFSSSIQVSSLEMSHCNTTNDACSSDVFNMRENHTCFCSVTTNQPPQLVGGVIGWPVVNASGHLVGLTASPRNPTDGTLVAAMITDEVRRMIEEYIGVDILLSQNSPSLVYRERELSNEFLIYDYLAAQFRTPVPPVVKPGAEGLSGATKLSIHIFYALLGFFGRPCVM